MKLNTLHLYLQIKSIQMTVEELTKSNELNIEKRSLLNIMMTQNILSERLSEILKPFDISAEQFNVLRILRGQNNAPANMALIQERMVAKTSNTTRLVDKLLAKNLVTREVCSDNRRKIEVSITALGNDLLSILDPKIENYEQGFASNLTENELVLLNELLEKYRK